MSHTYTLKAAVLMGFVSIATQSAFGGTILYEDFSYADGTLVGGRTPPPPDQSGLQLKGISHWTANSSVK